MRLLIFATLVATTVSAQWLRQPTPGIARLPNGRPDLAAPASKSTDGKPDLSGIWRINLPPQGADLTTGLEPREIQPWARAVHQKRIDNLLKDAPAIACLPIGPLASVYSTPEGLKIVQTPGLIVMLYPDLEFRQVFLDGRKLEENPNPAWMGFSVGHWEGDTLVVESNGFNDRSWLDIEGHPHTEALRVTERLHRTSFGTMDLSVTFEDPEIYARPIHVNTTMQAITDTEMIEYVCAENEKDTKHLVGTASDDPTMELTPDALAKYVGTYSLSGVAPFPIPIAVELAGSNLIVDHPIFGRIQLRPIGTGLFSARGATVLFGEEGGTSTLVFRAVEGDFKAIRKQ